MRFRKKSGAIVCPKCGKLVDVKAPSCPSCGLWRPGLGGFTPWVLKIKDIPFKDGILALCIVFYVGSLLIYPEKGAQGFLGRLTPSSKALCAMGSAGTLTTSLLGRWETLLTATFLHANLMHIVFNMIWTWQLAPVIVESYGSPRFLLIFLLSAVIGNGLEILIGGSPILVGASGGVYGLFGALVCYGLKRGGIAGSRALNFGLFWAGLGLLLSVSIPHVALWAHLGGFLGGAGCAAVWGSEETKKTGPWLCLTAVFAALCVPAAFIAYLGFPPENLEEVLGYLSQR